MDLLLFCTMAVFLAYAESPRIAFLWFSAAIGGYLIGRIERANRGTKS